jgi:hypothetical protein
MKKNEIDKTENTKIEIEQVQDITPHNKALYEAGKKLLVDSVDIGREFCKFMTTTTLGAIPAYLALLKLVLPKDYSLQSYDEILFLAPPMIFLIAAVFFILGYFPQRGRLSLDLPAEIERERSTTIIRRNDMQSLHFLFFV